MNASKPKSHIILGIPKLPARCASLVMPFLLSIFMTCIVSIISTYKGLGADPHFVRIWLGAWLVSWVIAFPTLLLVLPVVRKTTAAIVRAD
ncbi:MAG: DUF2798 domain-containing protein [Lysobacter sp.]